MVLMALAILPPFPITLPRSSWLTRTLRTIDSSTSTKEEIETMYKKRGENAKNRSPEAKAAKKQKYLQTWANKTEEELLEHKKKSARPGKLNGAYGKHWFNNGIYKIFCKI